MCSSSSEGEQSAEKQFIGGNHHSTTHLHTSEGDYKRQYVAEHVKGVGDQRHRVGKIADDDFDEEKREGKRQHNAQAARLAAREAFSRAAHGARLWLWPVLQSPASCDSSQ